VVEREIYRWWKRDSGFEVSGRDLRSKRACHEERACLNTSLSSWRKLTVDLLETLLGCSKESRRKMAEQTRAIRH
jgi:hypothetical protein